MEVENNNNSGNITSEEKTLIDKLRQEIKDELPVSVTSLSVEDQNLFLVRWLRARDLHLEKSTIMLRTSLKWRDERKADQAVDLKLNSFFTENFHFTFSGTDKFGQPVCLIPLSDWDFRKLVNNPDRLPEFDDFVTFLLENICRRIKAEHDKRKENGDGPVTQVTVLVDVRTFPYAQLINLKELFHSKCAISISVAMKKMLEVPATYEAHYPEVLYRVIFINCPFFFGTVISMLKSVVATKTIAKFTCYSQMSEWQKDIKEMMDPVQIPEQYGGSKKM